MSSPARIDELRKKFDENPRRFFAPLANEYRKAGDFEQAVFICQEYLPQQPGHMSGHIVYGQTLFDMGRDEEAKAVFETALTLDPENLIALKHLGDIARQAGDIDGARSWYQRVLEADPRNDEIMQVIESMGGGGAAALAEAPSLTDHVTISFAEPPRPESEPSAGESQYEGYSTPTGLESSEESEPVEELVLEQSIDAEMPDAEEAAAFTSAAAAASEPETPELLDITDFAIGGIESASQYASEPEPLVAAAEAQLDDVDVEPTNENASAEDVEVPEPAVELATDIILGLPDDADDTDDTAEAPAEEPVPDFDVEATPARGEDLSRAIDQLEGLESFSMDAAVDAPLPVDAPPRVDAPEASSDEAAEPASPEPLATETMAELYAQQGHLESALDIYDQLLERSPEDAELRRRANEVERQFLGEAESVAAASEQASVVAGPTIREFFRELLDDRGVDDTAVEMPGEDSEHFGMGSSIEPEGSLDILFSDVATDDADQSAAMSLAQAFSGEDEDEESAALGGTPAHQAKDELSLDHVFRSATPARGSGAAGAFSLDQFFAGEPANGEMSGSSSDDAPRASDDIAQFNAWLNGLKKT